MRFGCQLLFLFLLLFISIGVFAQQSSAHISKKNFKKLTEQNELLQKDIQELEQQRLQLEKTLKDYDEKLKAFTGKLEEKERQFDEALPESDADQLMAASKQSDATHMSFNLQYLQLQSQLQNQSRQFAMIVDYMNTKLEAIKKTIKKSK
jgi:septal ring factor EnvC (AmiA/AmiB activator)